MKKRIEIVARGELSQDELGFVLRQLGRHGLSTEVISGNEAQEEPILGYATYEDLSTFGLSNQEYANSAKIWTRMWHRLMFHSKATRVHEEDRGRLNLHGYEFELFKVPHPRGDIYADYELNVDSLEVLVDSGVIEELPKIGVKTIQFAAEFVKSRRALLESRE